MPSVADGYIDAIRDGRIVGWALDPSLTEPCVVEFWIDNRLIGSVVADQPRPDLQAAGIGTGAHGFRFQVAPGLPRAAGAVLRAKLRHSGWELKGSGQVLAGEQPGAADRLPDWELIARHDAMWGVLSAEKYSKEKIDEAARREFFQSGSEFVAERIARAEALLGPVRRGTAVDFGCGVGRLTMPLAATFRSVVGIDVSETMPSTARDNCRANGIGNVRFVNSAAMSGDALLKGVDFLLSYIVFQHIPEADGQWIFRELLSAMAPGGVGCVHFVFCNLDGTTDATTPFVHDVHLGGGSVVGMQMNCYSANRIIRALHEVGASEFHVDHVVHGRHLGGIVYFRKG